MSMPRAATSVATRKRSSPALMRPIARSRAAWERSPEIWSASKPGALQERRHVAHVVLGVAEDDRALGLLVLEDAREVLLLLLRRRQVVEVLDLGGRGVPLDHRDELRLVQERARERQHLLGHRGREQAGLAPRRQEGADLLHVGPEAEGEQLVGLVEHHDAHRGEREPPRVQVVEHAPRRADEHVHARAQRVELRPVADAAVDRRGCARPRWRPIASISSHTWCASSRVGAITSAWGSARAGSIDEQDRDAEGAGLPAAGARLHDQVAAPLHQRDDPGLHRHRLLPAEVADPRAEVLGEAVEARGAARLTPKRGA